jgi:2-methylisocitrate lyase-like PEP mutase family enzyme
MVLNPLSVYRGQRQTAAQMYREIATTGSQRGLVAEKKLQTREDFQSLIDYDGQVAARGKMLGDKAK